MRGRGFVISICVLVVVFVIQTTIFSGPQEKLSEEDITAIRGVIDELSKATMSKDLAAVLALYTDQTIELYPNEVANVGKANMKRRWEGFWPNYDYKKVNDIAIDIIGSGDTAVSYGRFNRTFRYRDNEELTTREGRQFFLFKKIDGSWKIALAHWIFD
jgi:ketosteroid isomerase-like protein